ncbi:Gfo/Idh/MocA family protein [Paenibacillus thalictri]|uniref:Gfo/Idh/MocA family oxidoreductase n=1 Tax=Paenibacillus thalictri TaxID=2527873 RepID=A0A4Q9DP43_9BACL|nr:Gfo/Idh/MocA family oxidoreductase [Paenibacillus thalictri]TBL77866.1 Gfo/Idh/MocA family oxidoreductase [Paenibacillus thalictri]
MRKVKVGLIGCGVISETYLKVCTESFDVIDIVACADLVPELARQRAEQFGIAKTCSVEDMLADPEIEMILNLTVPKAHAEINMRALEAGKHVFTEKPFALAQEDAEKVLALAEAKGLRVGCAPDTFLGGGIQSCIKLIDDGWIGTPFGGSGLILTGNAADRTHRSPENFLSLGGDPLFDVGVYYITAFVAMLGPVRKVSGSASQLRTELKLLNPKSPRYGDTVPVTAPMNTSAVLDFACGATATLTAAKEGFGYTPRMEIYGTDGILYVPDPNGFGGPIQVKQRSGEIVQFPLSHGLTEQSRGVGLADMAYAIQSGRPHRASGSLATHVLNVMFGIFESSQTERHVPVQFQCERPAPFPLGLRFHHLDE